MHRAFWIPLFLFLSRLIRNGGVHPSKVQNLLPWLTKFILFEPLRLAELVLYENKINKITKIDDPVFILGYYRSGTTYLQRLLTQDEQYAGLNVFQTSMPEIMLGFENLLKPVLSSLTRRFKVEDKFHKVPFSWEAPGEEDVALTAFGVVETVNWGNIFPNNYERYFKGYTGFQIPEEELEKWKNE